MALLKHRTIIWDLIVNFFNDVKAIQNYQNTLTAQREVVNMFKKQQELLDERIGQQTRIIQQDIGPEISRVYANFVVSSCILIS